MYIEWMLSQVGSGDEPPRRKSAIEGRWRNQLGSVMEITVDDDHRIEGSFQTGVGAMEPTTHFHVTGFAEGEALTFCVDFGRLGSVAAWSGHHVNDGDGERLITLWHLAQRVREPHGEVDTWRAISTGSDEFTRVTD
jgi:hypothetical protein